VDSSAERPSEFSLEPGNLPVIVLFKVRLD
jgi:hypothetical protein